MGKIITLDQQLDRVQPVRNPHGGCMLDGVHVADTLMCCHCGKIWIVMKGSGIRRGFCTKCMGVTCGRPECDTCMPQEKRLDLIEKGILKDS
jgi:hypothetical protein